jgi:hypothetical protein
VTIFLTLLSAIGDTILGGDAEEARRELRQGRVDFVTEPYAVRVYRLGLTRRLRAEVIRDGMVIAWANISGEGPPSDAVALARQWAASLGYATPEPGGRGLQPSVP